MVSFGLVVILMGLAIMWFSWKTSRDLIRLHIWGATASAQVTEVDWVADASEFSIANHYLAYRFAPASQPATICTRTAWYTRRPAVEIGGEIAIRYLPDNPEISCPSNQARLGDLVMSVAGGGIGLLILGGGILMSGAVRGRNRRYK